MLLGAYMLCIPYGGKFHWNFRFRPCKHIFVVLFSLCGLSTSSLQLLSRLSYCPDFRGFVFGLSVKPNKNFLLYSNTVCVYMTVYVYCLSIIIIVCSGTHAVNTCVPHHRSLYNTFASPWADAPCRPQDIGQYTYSTYLLLYGVPMLTVWSYLQNIWH